MKPKSREMNSEKGPEKRAKKSGKKGNIKLYIPAVATVGALAIGGVIIGVNASGTKEAAATTVYKETTVGKGNITAGVTESGSTELGTDTFNYDIGTVTTASTSSGSSSSGSGSSTGNSAGESSSAAGGLAGATAASSGSSSSGSLNSSGSSSSSSSVSTELEVEEIYVAESDTVTQGAAILKVTDASYQKVLKDLTEAVATAELNLKQAQIERTLTQVDSDNTYTINKSKKTTAQETYNNTVTKLQNAVDKAKKELDDADVQITEYQEIINTYTDDELSALEAKSNTEKVTEAKEKLKTLQNSYSSLQLEYQESLIAQKEGLLSAKEQLDQDLVTASNADALYEISINGIDDDVEDAEDELENAKEVLTAFQAFVVDGIIYSDFEGMITEISCEEGGVISSGSTVLTYAESDQVTLTVSVDQEDIASVAINDEVNIEFTAYSKVTYKGTVTEISTSSSSENSSTVSYPVTVTVSGDVSSLYSGMSGNVTFVTKAVKDVIYVSNKAVTAKNGKSYVTVKNDSGAYEQMEVTAGFSNGTDVEIQSGLKDGDTVYIESQVNAQ